jgi:hypothetical protein
MRDYQSTVNSLTGAMGPTTTANWNNGYTLTGPAYSLGSQPLYFSPSRGMYVTSSDLPASMASVSFAFGKRRKRKVRKVRKSRKVSKVRKVSKSRRVSKVRKVRKPRKSRN